mgnify:CR=1 FL=1
MQKTSTASIMNKLYYVIIFFSLIMLATCNPAYSQSKKDSVVLTDTTKFLSIQDLLKFSDPYKDKYSARAWESFNAIFNAVINDAIKEWNEKNQKPKKP